MKYMFEVSDLNTVKLKFSRCQADLHSYPMKASFMPQKLIYLPALALWCGEVESSAKYVNDKGYFIKCIALFQQTKIKMMIDYRV